MGGAPALSKKGGRWNCYKLRCEAK